MRVVLGYCDKDEDQAVRLAAWMKQLGPYSGHSLFVARDKTSLVRPFANVGFDKVDEIEISNDAWQHWPESCNNVFKICSRHIFELLGAGPFLWLEPDVVPLREGWLNAIQAEYYKCGKPFMGDFVSVTRPDGKVPDHMSGVGIYPSDLHNHAGAVLLAHDEAWDMAARNQILPRMATSKLILHAWQHPPFTNINEIQGQIFAFKPECVLFHADKSGSLIELLRQQKAGVVGLAPAGVAFPSPAVEQAATPVCDILIKSYPPDYERLKYCLRSINKFAKGFRNTIIVVPHGEKKLPDVGYKVMEVAEHGDGYLYQQAVKACAHDFTDAEYVLHIDSDTMLTRPVTPQTFMKDGKVIWLYTAYSEIVTPWQKITEKFMEEAIDYEFMRRLPLFIPTWLHREADQFSRTRHNMRLQDYIMVQPDRAFSEFNALGAIAFTRHRDKFAWINTTTEPMPDMVAIQRWSGDAFDDGVKAKCEEILNSNGINEAMHCPYCRSPDGQWCPYCAAWKDPNYPKSTNGATELDKELNDALKPYVKEYKVLKLEQKRAAMAHARAVRAENIRLGIKPKKKRRKRRKVAA